MVDWKNYVRAHLPPLGLRAERELEIIEELAQHLEDRYEGLLAAQLGKDFPNQNTGLRLEVTPPGFVMPEIRSETGATIAAIEIPFATTL